MVFYRGRNNRKYYYPDKRSMTLLIEKSLRDEFSNFCKVNKLKKNKLIEKYIQEIIIRWKRDNTYSYITINLNPNRA